MNIWFLLTKIHLPIKCYVPWTWMNSITLYGFSIDFASPNKFIYSLKNLLRPIYHIVSKQMKINNTMLQQRWRIWHFFLSCFDSVEDVCFSTSMIITALEMNCFLAIVFDCFIRSSYVIFQIQQFLKTNFHFVKCCSVDVGSLLLLYSVVSLDLLLVSYCIL